MTSRGRLRFCWKRSLMTILLTGGAGFIGSHLAERLLALGHKLILLDELNDFYSPEIKQRNLAEIKTRGNYEFAEADICDLPDLTQLFKQHRPEIVMHLAARAGVRPSLEQPLLYEKVNVQGTLHLLELARQFLFGGLSSPLPVPFTALRVARPLRKMRLIPTLFRLTV